MSARLLVLCAVLLATPAAHAAMPLSPGSPPTLSWGEHLLTLQGGWPVQAVALEWGTARGWNNGAFATLDLRGPDHTWGAGMSLARSVAHGARTSLLLHIAGAVDLQHRRGGPVRFGGEGRVGLLLGVGLGPRHLTSLELGLVPTFRFGPGAFDRRPWLAAHGTAGFTAWLSRQVSVSGRGRAGPAARPGDPITLDWGAALVFGRVF